MGKVLVELERNDVKTSECCEWLREFHNQAKAFSDSGASAATAPMQIITDSRQRQCDQTSQKAFTSTEAS
jgi:hypothetical protein